MANRDMAFNARKASQYCSVSDESFGLIVKPIDYSSQQGRPLVNRIELQRLFPSAHQVQPSESQCGSLGSRPQLDWWFHQCSNRPQGLESPTLLCVDRA